MSPPQLSQDELKEIYTFALELGKNAGQILMDGVDKRCAGSGADEQVEKMNSVDIVTQTDKGKKLMAARELPF
jgi:myo-inositol-1(or 4)-monophosphatase